MLISLLTLSSQRVHTDQLYWLSDVKMYSFIELSHLPMLTFSDLVFASQFAVLISTF